VFDGLFYINIPRYEYVTENFPYTRL